MGSRILVFSFGQYQSCDEKVLIPGDPEREMETDRLKHGIPLLNLVIDDLEEVAAKFNLLLPKQHI